MTPALAGLFLLFARPGSCADKIERTESHFVLSHADRPTVSEFKDVVAQQLRSVEGAPDGGLGLLESVARSPDSDLPGIALSQASAREILRLVRDPATARLGDDPLKRMELIDRFGENNLKEIEALSRARQSLAEAPGVDAQTAGQSLAKLFEDRIADPLSPTNPGRIVDLRTPDAHLLLSRLLPAARFLRPEVDYAKEASALPTTEMRITLQGFSPEQRELILELAKIGPIVDRIYRRQRSGPLAERMLSTLDASSDPRAASARRLIELHAGPYVQERGNSSLFQVPHYPAHGFAYPPDFSAQELERYAAEHPSEKERLYSPYTAIERRSDGGLSARYFHEVFAPEVQAVAQVLRSAAAKTRHEGLRNYLEAKARDLLKDDYQESWGLWRHLKGAPVNIVVGPAEEYEDTLLGKKQTFTFALYVPDPHGGKILRDLQETAASLGRALPLEPDHNPFLSTPGYHPDGDMESVDLVAVGGDNTTYPPAGWALPNETEIVARHGRKMLVMRNVNSTRASLVMDFAQRRLFGEAYDPATFYSFVAGHEQGHVLLPKTIGFKPGGQDFSSALKDLAMPIEEKKADLLSLLALDELVRAGRLSRADYWAVARMYLAADNVYCLYRDPEDAYGKYAMVVHNLLKERGAVTVLPSGELRLTESFPAAIRELAGLFLKIEAEGDRAEAERLLREHNSPAPEIAAVLQALRDEKIPAMTRYRFSFVQ